ncbi:MAG: DUF2007 domain-containing protein [Porphyromonadaceae bacterium]|jgi:hypothetical protein|nr:DUF2007 domain-containing protein [Porphyromonadaceae bacterium]
MKEEKVVSFKFYSSMIDAEVEIDVLKNNGIDCMLNDATMVGVFPIFDDRERGIEVMVFEKDLEKAKKLVEEYHKEV